VWLEKIRRFESDGCESLPLRQFLQSQPLTSHFAESGWPAPVSAVGVLVSCRVCWSLLSCRVTRCAHTSSTPLSKLTSERIHRRLSRWIASRFIARFQTDFPSEVALPAIDIVLAQAAKRDKVQPLGSVGMGSGDNNLSYISRYDLELLSWRRRCNGSPPIGQPRCSRRVGIHCHTAASFRRTACPQMVPCGPGGICAALRRASRAVHRGELQSSVAQAAALSAAPAVTPAPTIALALWA
jgi:hypothetical protein